MNDRKRMSESIYFDGFGCVSVGDKQCSEKINGIVRVLPSSSMFCYATYNQSLPSTDSKAAGYNTGERGNTKMKGGE